MGSLKILSRENGHFANRQEAGRLLGRALTHERSSKTIVLGIPRGGLVIAKQVAQELDADLDVVFAHKLGAPGHPECAIGAVGEDGKGVMDSSLFFPVGRQYLEQEKKSQMIAMERRMKEYRAVLPKISLERRIVIVTDDGVAMGYTMEAALGSLRIQKPQKIILALPVGPKDTIERLARLADETVSLMVPAWFEGVSQFYQEFSQVDDLEVLRILEEERLRRTQPREKNSQTA